MNKLDLWLRLFDSVCLFNKGRSDIRSVDSIIEDTNAVYDVMSIRFRKDVERDHAVVTTGFTSPDAGYTNPGSTTITD